MIPLRKTKQNIQEKNEDEKLTDSQSKGSAQQANLKISKSNKNKTSKDVSSENSDEKKAIEYIAEEDFVPKKRSYHFGEKLRQVREHKGYTLKIVAQRAGVSESLVSQIERNHVSPAIDTLLALAEVLDINLEYLFDEYRRDRPVEVIRSGERPTLHEDKIVFEGLAKQASTDPSIEAYIMKIPAGSQTHRGSYGHLGREIGYITKGKALLTYANQEYILEEGDSVSFSAGAAHIVQNVGDVDLEAIWVVTPAQRFVSH